MTRYAPTRSLVNSTPDFPNGLTVGPAFSSKMLGQNVAISASQWGTIKPFDFTYNGTFNATDALAVARLATLVQATSSGFPESSWNATYGSNYGTKKVGLGFTAGTNNQMLRAVANLSDEGYSNNVNGVIFGYMGSGPRVIASDYDLETEATNTLRLIADTTIFPVGNVGIGVTTAGAKLDVAGTLRLNGTTAGTNYTEIKSAATPTTNAAYTLPSDVPAGTGYALTSTTGGIMSWEAIGASLSVANLWSQTQSFSTMTAPYVTYNSSSYPLDYNRSGTVSGADVTNLLRWIRGYTATAVYPEPIFSLKSSYGSKSVGIGFHVGTNSDSWGVVLNDLNRPAYASNVNAMIVGYATGGPRLLISDYDLATDEPNTFRFAGGLTYFPSYAVVIGDDGTSVGGTPIAGTIRGGNARYLLNTSGSSLTIAGGSGTGTAVGGDIIIQTTPGNSSGTVGPFSGNIDSGLDTISGISSTAGLLVGMFVQSTTSTTGTGIGTLSAGSSYGYGVIQSVSSSTITIFPKARFAGSITFNASSVNSPVERVRINASGYVGIGTTSPGSSLDVKGTLRLSGSTSGYVGFSVPADAGSTTYLLPAADGTNGQVLSTNSTGTLSWVTASEGGGASLSTANTWTATQTFNVNQIIAGGVNPVVNDGYSYFSSYAYTALLTSGWNPTLGTSPTFTTSTTTYNSTSKLHAGTLTASGGATMTFLSGSGGDLITATHTAASGGAVTTVTLLVSTSVTAATSVDFTSSVSVAAGTLTYASIVVQRNISLLRGRINSTVIADASGNNMNALGFGTSYINNNLTSSFVAGGNALTISTTAGGQALLTLGYGNSGSSIGSGIIRATKITGSNNTDGGSLTICGGTGTGTGVGGQILFTTGQSVASGNTSHTLVERMRINGDGYVGIGTTIPGSTLDVKGTLRLSGSTSGYVGFSVPANAGSTTYLLPAADGTNGQVLSTNSTGTLSWVTASGGGGASLSTANTWTANQTFDTSSIFSSMYLTNVTDWPTLYVWNPTYVSGATYTTSANAGSGTSWTGTLTASSGATMTFLINDVIIATHTATSGAAVTTITLTVAAAVTAAASVTFTSTASVAAGTLTYESVVVKRNIYRNRGKISATVVTGDYGALLNGLSFFASESDGTFSSDYGTSATFARGGLLILGFNEGTSMTGSSIGSGTIRATNTTGTNNAGGNLTISGGTGTGTGASGQIIFRTGQVEASGTTSHTATYRMIIDSGGNVGIGNYDNDGYDTRGMPGATLEIFGQMRIKGTTAGYLGFSAAASSSSTTYTFPSADGTNGQVLSTNGAATLSWATPAAGSITQVTFAQSTAAPNTTVYVDSMTAAATTTNADLALRPKGTGALTAQVADSTATGGDKRGTYATDWQRDRSSQLHVASGTYSVVSGGSGNKAATNLSVVGGGHNNSITTSGLNVIAGGQYNSITGNGASFIGGGYANLISTYGQYAVIAGGDTNTADAGYASIGGGASNVASGFYSTITGGYYANTHEIHGKVAHANGRFSVTGDAQLGQYILRGTTTTNTPALVLTADTNAASIYNTVALGNNKVYLYKIELVANSAVAGSASSFVYGTSGGNWSLSGLIRRTANAASTALIGTPAVAAANIDAAIQNCVVALTANTTLGGLQIAVTGIATTNIHWVAVVTTTEVG